MNFDRPEGSKESIKPEMTQEDRARSFGLDSNASIEEIEAAEAGESARVSKELSGGKEPKKENRGAAAA